MEDDLLEEVVDVLPVEERGRRRPRDGHRNPKVIHGGCWRIDRHSDI